MQTDWHGKPKVRHMTPLLPGYVFCLCSPDDFADLHGMEGIAGLVRYMRDDGVLWPLAFPGKDILGLQTDERAGLFDRTRKVKAPRYQPKKGERVMIKAGTYQGFFAKVLAAPSSERRKILIEGFDPPRHKTLDVRHLEAA
jgi:transcription antitermination factor NusG